MVQDVESRRPFTFGRPQAAVAVLQCLSVEDSWYVHSTPYFVQRYMYVLRSTYEIHSVRSTWTYDGVQIRRVETVLPNHRTRQSTGSLYFPLQAASSIFHCKLHYTLHQGAVLRTLYLMPRTSCTVLRRCPSGQQL